MSRPSSPQQAADGPWALGVVRLGLAVAVALAVALVALRWHQDWNLSEGTYALTARGLLRGDDLYGATVVAQPPGMFLVGAGVLAVSDTLDGLRIAVVGLQLVAVALLATVVWRVTRSAWATALTPPLAVLLPWSVHEQGVLQAEAVALPLLAGAAVLGARRRGAPWAGVLLALAVGTKLPMLLPALLGVWFAADRRAAAAGFSATLAVVVGASLAAFGTGLVDQAVLAQLEVGRHAPRYVVELLAQAAWNLAPLLVATLPAALAARRGWRSADPPQWRLACALAAGAVLTLGSLTKEGTSLTVLPPVEALLLPLAVTGAWLWVRPTLDRAERTGGVAPTDGAEPVLPVPPARPVRSAGSVRSAGPTDRGPVAAHRAPRSPAGRPSLPARRTVAVAVLAVLVLQPLSLLAAPRDGGALFRRPLSAPAWGLGLTRDETDAWVARLRACPRGRPSGAPTTVTFRAGRQMPGGQPDQFLPQHAPRLRSVARQVQASGPRCA